MSSPVWKVYSAQGEYVAACKDAEDAAALVGLRGDGATIRYDHKHIVWREGAEECSASDSYDFAAYTASIRWSAICIAARQRRDSLSSGTQP